MSGPAGRIPKVPRENSRGRIFPIVSSGVEGQFSAKVSDGLPDGSAGFDPSVPNVARIYDYWLGGRENFQADRAAARHLAKLVPCVEHVARDSRAFMHRVVGFLAGQGIVQFLDVGTGMPGTPSVLDIALQVNPNARVAYVDYDPIVVSHGRAMLKSRQGVVVQGDLREPASVLGHPSVRGHLDFAKPVAVLLLGVLHYVSDDDDPAGIVSACRDSLASGSYLAIGHVTHDKAPDSVVSRSVAAFTKTSATLWPRTADQILGLFDGVDLVDPGVVPVRTWRPDPGDPPGRAKDFVLGGVARKS